MAWRMWCRSSFEMAPSLSVSYTWNTTGEGGHGRRWEGSGWEWVGMGGEEMGGEGMGGEKDGRRWEGMGVGGNGGERERDRFIHSIFFSFEFIGCSCPFFELRNLAKVLTNCLKFTFSTDTVESFLHHTHTLPHGTKLTTHSLIGEECLYDPGAERVDRQLRDQHQVLPTGEEIT